MNLETAKPAQILYLRARQAIGQFLFLYEMSGDPEDLYHLVDPDYKKAAIWIHLKRGDNIDMKGVIESANAYVAANPPPGGMETDWAGLTYINVVWQDKMVSGMRSALVGSFIIVTIIMMILFRSILWGLVSVVPLVVTVTFIYGLVGFVGKELRHADSRAFISNPWPICRLRHTPCPARETDI